MTLQNLHKTKFQKIFPGSFDRKHLRGIVNEIRTSFIGSSMMICLFSFALFFSQNAQAQSYGDSVVFGDSNQYGFDYTLVCSGDGTTALLTVDFTSPPPGNVPQIHLGGGNFVSLTGPNPYTYTFTGLTGCDFSFQFWIAYEGGLYSSDFMDPSNTALPINLISFSATKSGPKSTSLEWHTASEINSDYFGVERSVDGTNWESIDQIRARGNSYEELSYSYLDSDLPLDHISDVVFYYRLRMTDLDGTYEYSKMVSVEYGNNARKISVYPNPTSDYINVDLRDIDTETGEIVQLILYSDSGSEVMTKEVNDTDIELIDVSDLPSGTYFVIMKQGRETIFQTNITKVK